MKNILFVLFPFSGTIWAQEKNEEINSIASTIRIGSQWLS